MRDARPDSPLSGPEADLNADVIRCQVITLTEISAHGFGMPEVPSPWQSPRIPEATPLGAEWGSQDGNNLPVSLQLRFSIGVVVPR